MEGEEEEEERDGEKEVSLQVIRPSNFVVQVCLPAFPQQFYGSSQLEKKCFGCDVPDTNISCEECPHSLICLWGRVVREKPTREMKDM